MPVVPLTDIAGRRRSTSGTASRPSTSSTTSPSRPCCAAAVESRSPLIVQTSVKTVRSIGSGVLKAMWDVHDGRHRGAGDPASRPLPRTRGHHRVPRPRAGTRCCSTPPTCRSRRTCARRSRSSPRPASTAPTSRARSSRSPASRTGSARDTEAARQIARRRRWTSSRRTEVDVFAPAIGNAHGVLQAGAGARLPARLGHRGGHPIPIALHGGSGLSDEQFHDLIARGCAKVNISTALKETYMKSNLRFLRGDGGQGQVGSALALPGRPGRRRRDDRRPDDAVRQRREGRVADARPDLRL